MNSPLLLGNQLDEKFTKFQLDLFNYPKTFRLSFKSGREYYDTLIKVVASELNLAPSPKVYKGRIHY